MTSSAAMFEAATWVKSMYMTKSHDLKPKKIKYGNQRNLYINLLLIDGLGMNSQFVKAS